MSIDPQQEIEISRVVEAHYKYITVGKPDLTMVRAWRYYFTPVLYEAYVTLLSPRLQQIFDYDDLYDGNIPAMALAMGLPPARVRRYLHSLDTVLAPFRSQADQEFEQCIQQSITMSQQGKEKRN